MRCISGRNCSRHWTPGANTDRARFVLVVLKTNDMPKLMPQGARLICTTQSRQIYHLIAAIVWLAPRVRRDVDVVLISRRLLDELYDSTRTRVPIVHRGDN